MQRISVNKTNHSIHWIVIYPVDSVIQPLNNRGQFTNELRGYLAWQWIKERRLIIRFVYTLAKL